MALILAGEIEQHDQAPVVYQPLAEVRLCVAGATGMGKSFLVRRLCRGVRRLLAWDPEGDWAGPYLLEDGTPGDGLGGGRIGVDELDQRSKSGELDHGVLRIAVRPDWRNDLKEEFERFCRAVRRIGAVTAVVEEISYVSSPASVGPEFNRLIVGGRHRGVSLFMVGQRYAQFPRAATGNASHLAIFRQHENADVDYLRPRLGDELAEKVQQLPKGWFASWTPEGGARLNEPIR